MHQSCLFRNSSALLNFCFRKMNVVRCPEQKTLSKDDQPTCKGSSFSSVYAMSRIDGLSNIINSFSTGMCPGLNVKEIHVTADANVIDPSCFELQNAEIVVCDPILLGHNYRKMTNLKWAHCTWAGVEPLFRLMKQKPSFIVTKHSHEDFSEQMAEYVMAHVLIIEKNYRNMWAAEMEKTWSKMGDCSHSASNRQLRDLTLGILGVGNMGQAIARFFKHHGSNVIGLSRTPRKSSEFGPFDRIDVSLRDIISSCDYIVNTLPSHPQTVGLLDGDILKTCEKKPVFINVGRGDIAHEDTLVKALESNWLSHVVLDVFQVEPLPAESKLWNCRQVTVTPHCAAISLPKNIAKDFITSYLKYQQNIPLDNVVDWEKGY